MLGVIRRSEREEGKMRIRMSSKGQVVLPAEIRRKYRLGAGSELELVDVGDHLLAWPVAADPVSRLRGLLAAKPGERPLTEALLEARAAERAAAKIIGD
jgi:AbrB family looped-hinge helix DNA binding protein